MNVIVNSLIVNYERRGRGRLVVLIHGWGDTLKTFDTLTKELSKSYDTLALDLPGFGSSQPPEAPWGLEEYAKFVADFLAKINANEIYALIGHSNGGAIAIKGLANGIIKADKLILIASAGIRARENARKVAWKVVAKAGKVATVLLPQATRQKLRRRLYAGIGSDLLVAPHMQETFKKVVAEDLQPEAVLLQLPTLLVYGREDAATPPIYAEIFHKLIENSKLYFVDEAGHFVHQGKASEVAAVVENFLR